MVVNGCHLYQGVTIMNAGFQAGAPTGDNRTKDLIATVSSIAHSLMGEVAKVIIGKNENLRRVTVGILSNGNMLLEDFPGLAKTLLANTFAQALGCKFKRVQFTPDLLPSDIMGTYMYDQKTGEFKLRAGPLFANILLADEINRAPPKTQAALLEAMEEKQVTIEGVTHKLPAPFVVIATQNPIEQEGTYPLPEAQMDRFLMKMSMGYPDRAEEKAILARRKLRGKDSHDVEQITSPKKVVAMQKALETVHVDPAILSYIIEIVQRTREDHRVVNGASPRASQALFKSGRAAAAIDGRDFVIPDDIKGIALQIISHRINMKPEAKIRGITGMHIVRKILSEVPVPVIQQG
jgi:MoxR-like ATPase|tara:strand:+ start:292 stop:1341 length:1050 start_codon:yes stop_codon:yes gene_type:complete